MYQSIIFCVSDMTTVTASEAFEAYLQTQPTDAQTGCLLWLWASQGPEGLASFQSNTLQTVLESLQSLTSEEGVSILSRQRLEDVVGWTVIHEFGPAMAHKAIYPRLVQSVCQRLQTNNNLQSISA